jgi:hypothetical protein
MASFLDNQNSALLLIAIMLDKLGGKIEITQDDVNNVAFDAVYEHSENGVITFALEVVDEKSYV